MLAGNGRGNCISNSLLYCVFALSQIMGILGTESDSPDKCRLKIRVWQVFLLSFVNLLLCNALYEDSFS